MPEKRISFHGHSPASSESSVWSSVEPPSIFLLSPANLSGPRGKLLLSESSQSDLARRLRSSQATLGEVFSFVSRLYFRGKLEYATRFAHPSQGLSGVRIITSSSGLLHPNYLVTIDWLRSAIDSRIDIDNPQYRDPLIRDAQNLNDDLLPQTRIILLGSIATFKYVEPLLETFGPRLFFPTEFLGRGEMSRGSLLLRCARHEVQLNYTPADSTIHAMRWSKR